MGVVDDSSGSDVAHLHEPGKPASSCEAVLGDSEGDPRTAAAQQAGAQNQHVPGVSSPAHRHTYDEHLNKNAGDSTSTSTTTNQLHCSQRRLCRPASEATATRAALPHTVIACRHSAQLT